MFSDQIDHLRCDSITIDRETRQRRTIDVSDLLPSVRAKGVMNPIIVTRDLKLVAGERRLTASIECGRETIPVRYSDTLSTIELELIELEENLNRKDLPWQDEALAIRRIHALYLLEAEAEEREWSSALTGTAISRSARHVDRMIDLGEQIAAGDKAVFECDTIANATTLLSRRRTRAADQAVNEILGMEQILSPNLSEETSDGSDVSSEPLHEDDESSSSVSVAPAPSSNKSRLAPKGPAERFRIEQANAIEFFQTYAGPKFNFLHCDFPYGVDLNEQAGQTSFEAGGYEGGEEVYWPLIEAMIENWNKFMFPSSHLMFWFSFSKDLHDRTKSALLTIPGIKLNPVPLIWHKTDNRGIISDPNRGPRNIFEPAFMASTSDRHIVKPVSNVYGGPTDKANSIHTNEKTEPMLKHFFSMFVDENTRMLDPTCGSGSSVRSAEALGAEAALGLEMNPEFASRAAARLLSVRNLRNLSEKAKANAE